MPIPANGDRMLVHLDSRGLVDDAGHFERGLALHEPSAERDAVAEIIQQAAAARGLLVPPGTRLLRLDLFGRNFYLVGEVKERAAIAVVIVHLDQVADCAFVKQPLGGVVRAIPGERPVDGEAIPRVLCRRQHPSRVRHGGREGLFDEDVEAVWCELLDIMRVLGGSGTDDGEIGLRSRQAGLEIGEHPVLRNGERRDRSFHPRAVRMEDSGDFGVGMLGHLTQKVAHMHVVEIDSQDAVLRHHSNPRRDSPPDHPAKGWKLACFQAQAQAGCRPPSLIVVRYQPPLAWLEGSALSPAREMACAPPSLLQ